MSRARLIGNWMRRENQWKGLLKRARLSQILVSPGEEGATDQTCLHFKIRKGKQSQEPLEWLK